MCVIDEYAIMVRKWDWFIPIIPPSSALIEAINIMKVDDKLYKMNERMINGANFCHVARIIHISHDRDVITDGNQKWNGAIPSLSIIEAIRIIFINGIDDEAQWDILDISINLEPNACAIKYLIVASVSWFVFELDIRGIKLNILISMDIHRNIQLVLDIAIIVLIINDDRARVINGLFM